MTKFYMRYAYMYAITLEINQYVFLRLIKLSKLI